MAVVVWRPFPVAAEMAPTARSRVGSSRLSRLDFPAPDGPATAVIFVQRLTQLGDPLTRFRTDVKDRVDLLIAAKQASRQRRFAVRPGDIEIHLVDADDCRQIARLRHHQKPIEQAQVWLGIRTQRKERLIRVRQDDLLDVVGVTGEPGKRARSRFDRFDAPLALADISGEDPVPDGDEVGPPLPLEDALDRGRAALGRPN